MTYISWFNDFAMYFEDSTVDEHHTCTWDIGSMLHQN